MFLLNNRCAAGVAAVLAIALAAEASAAVLASTNFDSSSIGSSTNVKKNLNWTLNGLENPGDMVALNAAGNAQAIFDGNTFTQDIFVPGLNVGNNDTFWTTDVSLTVSPGSTVTLTDVTLNSVSVAGGQTENPNRFNDYTAFLYDPADVLVAEATVADTLAGAFTGTGTVVGAAGQPLVTLDLADTLLSDPGTYTLRIKGGDFTDFDETGNHTGLDNLSINGTVVVPEPATLCLAILGLAGLVGGVRRRR